MAEDTQGVDLGIDGYDHAVEIGRGGFAHVYRARQRAFERDVAVKILAPISLDDATIRRFDRECRAMGSLSWHPNIVTIYDAGTTHAGRPYLAMEDATGGSLADRVQRDGPVPWREVAEIGEKLASALAAAHEAGVLHCDVKPANVLVTRTGEPALADFGIAALANATHTQTGAVSATAAFAAPEVLEGHEPTAASDIYSLGTTLFFLLNGAPAFVHGDRESIISVIARVVSDPVPDLRQRGVPDDLCAAIERAMSKQPEKRWPSASAFHDALRAITHTVDASSPPAPVAAPAPATAPHVGDTPSTPSEDVASTAHAPRRRRRVALIATVGVAGIVAVVLAFVVLGNGGSGSSGTKFQYSESSKQAFLKNCDSSASKSKVISAAAARSFCACSLTFFQNNISFAEFKRLDLAAQSTQNSSILPKDFAPRLLRACPIGA
jgi:serine/threonine protein kinase